ncbi:FtsW/RodA/SpoVE family cell cycle protein [Thermodesulfobacterium hveragerdense]|uniref:FtsW/RodA/SpoVE family cell cycle protein n=1 Tax=Thermodesulfobacterium hveragerdense TaxID=53424 RepID=UPI00041323EA|nr:FtsW/RodA/SpoVE family cell cycle protein [Thermodesulfobacterium hveragerdense]
MQVKEDNHKEAIKRNLKGFLVVLALFALGNIHQFFIAESLGFFIKNLLWHVLGLSIFFFLLFFTDYKKVSFRALWYAYWILNFVLFIMLIFGKRWLNLGFLSLQPSEFVKFILLWLISLYLSREPSEVIPPKKLLKIFGLIALPLILIMPADLDYAFIMGVMFFSWLLFIGIPKRIFILLLSGVLLFSFVFVPIAWQKLKPHQKGRIYGYLEPEKYAKTWGYQLNQSLIAIGSGGLTGQKFYKGWSTRLGYLPAKHTDLAFAVWAETWGLLGVSVFLALYGYLIYFGICVSQTTKDWFGKYLSLGVSLIFLWQLFFNLGGCSGLLPMTSIPLPFLSYGGSITILVYILLYLLFNVAIKKYFFK